MSGLIALLLLPIWVLGRLFLLIDTTVGWYILAHVPATAAEYRLWSRFGLWKQAWNAWDERRIAAWEKKLKR